MPSNIKLHLGFGLSYRYVDLTWANSKGQFGHWNGVAKYFVLFNNTEIQTPTYLSTENSCGIVYTTDIKVLLSSYNIALENCSDKVLLSSYNIALENCSVKVLLSIYNIALENCSVKD